MAYKVRNSTIYTDKGIKNYLNYLAKRRKLQEKRERKRFIPRYSKCY
jgi:hypothetical protein